MFNRVNDKFDKNYKNYCSLGNSIEQKANPVDINVQVIVVEFSSWKIRYLYKTNASTGKISIDFSIMKVYLNPMVVIMKIKSSIDGVLWDYDGTLVNSALKNIDITKQIISEVCPRLSEENLPIYLTNENAYHFANHQAKNWQDLYLNYYKMTYDEMINAGKLWSKYQMINKTPVELFPQIKEVINTINLPQGICSQNSSENIFETLKKNNLSDRFKSVIGYDDIPNDKQKPLAFGGLKCIDQIFEKFENKTILYIGDHEGDVEFARNIDRELTKNCTVLSIGVTYSGADIDSWSLKPDYKIENPSDLLRLIKNYC